MLKHPENRRKLLRIGLSAVLLVAMAGTMVFASGAEVDAAAAGTSLITYSEGSYGKYLEDVVGNAAPGSAEIVIPGASYTPVEGDGHQILTDFEGMAGPSLLTAADGEAGWTFTCPEDGWYNLETVYYPYEGTGSSAVRKILIDGECPYTEAANVSFSRIWKDSMATGTSLDDAGNEVRSRQLEVPEWVTVFAKDESGKTADPLRFYLTAGEHTLVLDAVKEPLLINKLTFKVAPTAPSYEEALAAWKAKGAKEVSGVQVKVQGESAYRKSHMSIYPVNDRASGATENFDGSGYNYNKTTLNSIGGDKWVQVGQWIEWQVEVPEAGLYTLTVRGKQNVVDGNKSSRAIYINGELPYAEAGAMTFDYSTNYVINTFSNDDGEPYLFYFNKGTNVIRLENVLGEFAEVVNVGRSSVTILNNCYLKILMITGVAPDLDRDYRFKDLIPDVLETLYQQADVLDEMAEMLYARLGKNNSNISSLRQIAQRLRLMVDRQDRLAEYFSSFKSDLGTLSTMVNNLSSQPLQMDYMIISATDEKLPTKGEGGFFTGLIHEIRLFISSFTTDYTNIGATSKAKDAITVWYAGGIEQCKIIKQMATDEFSAQYKIPVNLQYIKIDALLPATLAGRAPDVALGQTAADPINYAMRDAVYDLSSFPDFQEVIKAFPECATMQFEYNGGVYALPETITFPLMFYRTDLVKSRNITLPKTWEDVYALLPDLQTSNMNFGYVISTTIDATPFVHFLYQYDGSLYKNDNMESNLDAPEAISAFIEWTDLYTTYQFDKVLDFSNRFRRGELPIGIFDYINGYNTLTLSAPEIKGLWTMAPVPGHMRADGTINNTVTATVTGCVLLSQSKNPENAWEFMKWWTSTDAQVRYSQEVESVLGAGARNHTANVEALRQLAWTNDELDVILAQLENTKGYPQVPGGYYSARYIYNGYVDSVINGLDQRETLLDKVEEINNELYNKRKEYGLSLPDRDR